MTSTRELANRLRTALGWIDSHADSIPGGWALFAYPNAAGVGMTWIDGDAATVEALTHLLGGPEPHPDGDIWTWRAEGDRPRLDVYTEAVTA